MKHCVRPCHLDPQTKSEHSVLHAVEKPRTHCKNGHEFTRENTATRVNKQNGRTSRVCLQCKSDRERARYKTLDEGQRKRQIDERSERRRRSKGYAEVAPAETIRRGENNGMAKLTWADAQEIRRRHASGVAIRALSREYGVAQNTARRIIRGEGWTAAR